MHNGFTINPVEIDNVFWQEVTVTRVQREQMNGHRSVVLWFTGFSGSGKSTLAHALEKVLHQHQCRTLVLDGDNVRFGLCADLGFSDQDRSENIRRISETAKLLVDAGVIVLAAFISPFRRDRSRVRSLFPLGDFFEIFCDVPLEICEQRDIKGLYRRAKAGEITEFTGISSPYEQPLNPELAIDTSRLQLDECVNQIMVLLKKQGIIR